MLVCSAIALPESLPRERRHPSGTKEMRASVRRVLSDRPFVGYTLVQAFGVSVLFAFISSSSLVLQSQYGLGPRSYSLLFALNAVVLIGGGVINNRLVRSHAPERILTIALGISAVGAVIGAAAALVLRQPPLWVLLPLISVSSICSSAIMANTTTLGLQRHPVDAGMASAMLGAVMSILSGVASQFVSIGGSATAVSMTLVMAVSAVLANIARSTLCRVRPT